MELSSPAVVQRQPLYPPPEDPRPPPGTPPAPSAATCGRPAHCPPGFCDPWPTEFEAKRHRAKNWWWIRLGIRAAVDSRVLPLWDTHVWGGSSTKDLTASFGSDFESSPTTARTSRFLTSAVERELRASPPSVAVGGTVTVDIPTLIPTGVAAIGDPTSSDRMNFNIPSDIPGNIAGDVAADQLACRSGKQPSPHDDERNVTGSAAVMRLSPTSLMVTPTLNYNVKDTIDLCPGNCGTTTEQLATVPISQWEATGISGDVPFTVDFTPALAPFFVTTP